MPTLWLRQPHCSVRLEKAGRFLLRPAFADKVAYRSYFVTWPRISPPGFAAV